MTITAKMEWKGEEQLESSTLTAWLAAVSRLVERAQVDGVPDEARIAYQYTSSDYGIPPVYRAGLHIQWVP